MPSVYTALRSGHWPSLFGAWLHFEVSFMVWLLVGAMGVSLADEFGLTALQKGMLLATPLLSGALLRIPVGIGSDRLGAKRTGLLILCCEGAGLLWGWQGASTFGELLGIGLVLGMAGSSFAVALPIAGRAYPPAHQGLALGIAASANSGVVLAMWVAPRIAASGGWHQAMMWMLLPVAVTFIIFARCVQPDPPRQWEGRSLWNAFQADLTSDPSLGWLCAMYAITFGGFVGFSSALPLFLHDQYGVAMVAAGSVTALCGLTGTILRPVGGYLADHLGGVRVLPVTLAGLAVLVSLLGALPSAPVAMALAWGAIAVMGFGNGVVFGIVADRFPKRIGVGSGIVGAAGAAGGALVPLGLGGLKDLLGTSALAFWLFAGCSCAAAMLVGRMIRPPNAVQDLRG